MPTSKNTKSKRASGNPTRKELQAYMNEEARVMRNNRGLAIKMPIAPGQGFKPKTSSTLKLMIPEIRDMAQRAREKKLANEFRPYMQKAKTHSIKNRLDNLNKSSPKKKELLDLEAELSDEKWYGGKKRRKQKTKKHKKKQKTRKNRKKSKK